MFKINDKITVFYPSYPVGGTGNDWQSGRSAGKSSIDDVFCHGKLFSTLMSKNLECINDQQPERGAEGQVALNFSWRKVTKNIHGKNNFNSTSEIYDSFVKNHDSNIEVKDIINAVGDGHGSGSVNVLAGRQPSLTPAYSTYRLS